MRLDGDDCTCTWMSVSAPAALAVPVMTTRDSECVLHGDGTKWWAKVQEHAAALSGSSIGGEANDG